MKKPDTKKAVEKARQPVTVPQKDTYTIEEIDKLIKENKPLPFKWAFHNPQILAQQVLFMSGSKSGYELLLKVGFGVPKESYKVFMNPDTNQTQRTRCLYDIARWEMIPHLLIGFRGNQPLPKELQDWNPIFGRNWFIKSMNEIPRSDMIGNMYWHFEAEKLYKQATMLERLPRVKELTMEVIENHSLLIKRDGDDAIIKRFDEMDVFTDGSTKKLNTLAHIFIDLSDSLEECLKANDPYATAFGKGAKNGKDQSSKHISQLAKALDSIVKTEDQELGGTATKRWFRVQDGTDKRWYPRFKFIPSRTAEERQMAQDVLNNTLSAMDVAEQVTEVHKQGGNLIKNNGARHLTSTKIWEESKILDE